MIDYSKFSKISPTAYADALEREQFMDIGIKSRMDTYPTHYRKSLHGKMSSWG